MDSQVSDAALVCPYDEHGPFSPHPQRAEAYILNANGAALLGQPLVIFGGMFRLINPDQP